ncbi:MAG: hypothetical protein K0R72_396 [Clostridia bacterium]|jgi:uncharacterized protein YihD (DUF1040 family)|nr:hypothetical protein [Clostridia bacterium]
MKDENLISAKAKYIRKMAEDGYGLKDIQCELRMTKKEIIRVLDKHYSEKFKNDILVILRLNEENKEKKVVIVIDTSYFISSKFLDIEKFICDNPNIVVPGTVLEELPTDSRDEKINYTSRRILTILFELDVKIEIADPSMLLDPTWKKDNDYYILTVCAKLKKQGFIVNLLTFDKKMILKARGIKIGIYPMEFPHENIKHCRTYLIRNLRENKAVQESPKALVSEESLKALKDKFSISKPRYNKKKSSIKKTVIVYRFDKPKGFTKTSIDDFKPDIVSCNGDIRLIDTSSVDLYVGILKLVITSYGKVKHLSIDQFYSYYMVEDLDKIVIFNKTSDCSIEMKIGRVDENNEFIQDSVEQLQEGNMRKINKKFHEAIREAFAKLLKISLKKVI